MFYFFVNARSPRCVGRSARNFVRWSLVEFYNSSSSSSSSSYGVLFQSVAVSAMWRQSARPEAFLHAEERPMFRGLRSASTERNHNNAHYNHYNAGPKFRGAHPQKILGAKNMQNLARFRTIPKFGGEYFRNGRRYSKSDKYLIYRNSSRVMRNKVGELWSSNLADLKYRHLFRRFSPPNFDVTWNRTKFCMFLYPKFY